MELFDYNDYSLSIKQKEALLIPEFKKILDSDKDENKSKAFKLLAYVYLVADWKSPYSELELSKLDTALSLNDEGLKLYKRELKENKQSLYTDERSLKSLNSCDLKEKDVDNDMVFNALKKYKEILESDLTIVVINSMKESIHKFKQYFKQIDFTKTVDSGPRKGSLVYSVSDYMRTMKDTDQIFDTIDKLEKTMKEKMKKSAGVRGNEEQPVSKY